MNDLAQSQRPESHLLELRFWDALTRSRLLSPAELTEARTITAVFGPEATADAAAHLADIGLITAWQSLQLLAGRTSFSLGPYRLLERIGSGAAATIFKARHVQLGSTVALKILTEAGPHNLVARARFRREVRAAAAVKHPNIVATYGGQCVGGIPYLAMEYVDGEDLERRLKRCEILPLAWCCEVARQVALGLEHIHQHGIVHRDVKPSNLLLIAHSPGKSPWVKIADLGAACMKPAAGESYTPLTTLNQFLGTPNFVAPEQVLNARDVDHRADIFSLGCTLFKLLTRETPWRGATLTEKLLARTKEDAPPASRFRPDAPSRLDEIIARMLARAPDQRFSRARDVADALQPFALGGQRMDRPPDAAPARPPRRPAADAADSWKGGSDMDPRLSGSAVRWRLEWRSAAGACDSYPLGGSDRIVVGRASDCDIQIKDLKVSRHHCRLTRRNASWYLEDLGSNNGTLVNGVAIQETELRHGDELRLGALVLTLVCAPQADAPLRAPFESVAAPLKPPASADDRIGTNPVGGSVICRRDQETIYVPSENDTSQAHPVRRRIRFGRRR